MGLIGLLVTVVLMILTAGYFFFGSSSVPLTVTNDTALPTITEGLSKYEETKSKALDVKKMVEEKAEETMRAGEGPASNNEQSTENSQQSTVNNQQKTEELHIENRLMSSGFLVLAQPRKIDTIVLHSSYDLLGKDPYFVEGIVKEYEDYGVSAHYLVDRKGIIYRLVQDKDIAYHAGVSKMPDGRTNANDFSIGIEMMNTETRQFTAAQYTAVNALISQLKKQYSIKSVVGHSDIAPGRKTDPWNFDWKKVQ